MDKTRASCCRRVFSLGMIYIYQGSWVYHWSSIGNPTGASMVTLPGTLMVKMSISGEGNLLPGVSVLWADVLTL